MASRLVSADVRLLITTAKALSAAVKALEGTPIEFRLAVSLSQRLKEMEQAIVVVENTY